VEYRDHILGDGTTVPTTKVGKELLEQYLYVSGVPIHPSNFYVHYTLPDTQCGNAVLALLNTEIQAVKLGR
jgi:hypothetical protein